MKKEEFKKVLDESGYSPEFAEMAMLFHERGMVDDVLAEKVAECVARKKKEMFALEVFFGGLGNVFGYEDIVPPTLDEFAEAGKDKVYEGLDEKGEFRYSVVIDSLKN